MRVFVTGATGVIGRRAIPLLLHAGHQVTAAGRSLDRMRDLHAAGATAVALDLFDPAAVRAAVGGHDAVVNLATHVPRSTIKQFLRSSWKDMDRIRTLGSATLVDAALAAGVRRFIQESFAPIYPDRGDQWIHEDVPLQPVSYNRSVLDAEASVQRFARSGEAGVALRFAFFYGPKDPFTEAVLGAARRGWFPVPGKPGAYFPMVHHQNAASAVATALAAPSGAYNVVDDEPLTRRQLADHVASLIGVRPPKLPPPWLAGLMGGLGRMLARSLRISNAKLKAQGWAPVYPTTKEAWTAAVLGGAGQPPEVVDHARRAHETHQA